VTGLVLTTDGNVSIGRSVKREVKSLVHKFTLGRLDVEEQNRLGGLLSFIRDVDFEFHKSLISKYSESNIILAEKGQPRA
jgi:RNA-directed DNA polymerase